MFAATAGLLSAAGSSEPGFAPDVPSDPDDRFRREEGYTELQGKALRRFLGPVSPAIARWFRQADVVGETYWSIMNPPLTGEAGISISTLSATHMPEPGGTDSLGPLRGRWSKGGGRGKYSAEFGFAEADYSWLRVYITAETETDREIIINEISRLPMFNATADTPFQNLRRWEQALRVLRWLLPVSFVASIWLGDRFLRRRNRSWLMRSSLLAVVCATWLLGFLLFATCSSFGWERAVFLVILDRTLKLWLVPLAAACSFCVFVLIAAVFLVRSLFLQPRFELPRA